MITFSNLCVLFSRGTGVSAQQSFYAPGDCYRLKCYAGRLSGKPKTSRCGCVTTTTMYSSWTTMCCGFLLQTFGHHYVAHCYIDRHGTPNNITIQQAELIFADCAPIKVCTAVICRALAVHSARVTCCLRHMWLLLSHWQHSWEASTHRRIWTSA